MLNFVAAKKVAAAKARGGSKQRAVPRWRAGKETGLRWMGGKVARGSEINVWLILVPDAEQARMTMTM
jgi:hypothetical protein